MEEENTTPQNEGAENQPAEQPAAPAEQPATEAEQPAA